MYHHSVNSWCVWAFGTCQVEEWSTLLGQTRLLEEEGSDQQECQKDKYTSIVTVLNIVTIWHKPHITLCQMSHCQIWTTATFCHTLSYNQCRYVCAYTTRECVYLLQGLVLCLACLSVHIQGQVAPEHLGHTCRHYQFRGRDYQHCLLLLWNGPCHTFLPLANVVITHCRAI